MNKDEQVIAGLRDLVNKWAWLNKVKMEASLKDYKPSEVHYIECIGKDTDSNLTEIADSLYMTRGAITKITRKLIKKGLLESYRKPGNRKQIYFRLTKQGQAINRLHEKLHKEFRERDKTVFEQVSDEQFDSMLDFVTRYCKHLDAEIQKLG